MPSYSHSQEDKIRIGIDCLDLSHVVRCPYAFTSDERRWLMTNLSNALPVEAASRMDENCNTYKKPTSNSQNFEIYRATAKDAGAAELLHRAQKIAMWFNRREFVGYVTLFSFRNPVFGTKVRVCQPPILPHWQGKGLGRELLLSVYDCVVYARDGVSELTVEDPCPGFQRLRDAVDLELLLRRYPYVATEQGAVPSEVEVAKTLKVIKSQGECIDFFALVREFWRANAAPISSSSTGTYSLPVVACSGTVPSVKALEAMEGFRTFRLKVKKRIVKNDKDLASLQPKSAMQQALSEEFATEFKRFLALQKAAARLKVIPSCLQ